MIRRRVLAVVLDATGARLVERGHDLAASIAGEN
jgi:hypothetical protein